MRITIPGMTLSAIGPGMWDCSQLAKTQIIAVGKESALARIAAEHLGLATLAAIDKGEDVSELARVAFHYARKVIR